MHAEEARTSSIPASPPSGNGPPSTVIAPDRSHTGAAVTDTEVVPASEPLAALAQRANDAHGAFQRGAGEALGHAIEAGNALREAKQRVAAGEWLSWLAQNVEFSERTARLYMQLSAHPAMADRQRVADLSLRAAAKVVAAPRKSTQTAAMPLKVGAGKRRGQAATQPPSIPKPDPGQLTRVRQVLTAIDPALERAQTGELSAEASAKLFREAAAAARAVADGLEALALKLEQ